MQKNLLIEEQSKGRHQNMKTYKILIIEDDPVIQSELETLLRGNGYTAVSVKDFSKVNDTFKAEDLQQHNSFCFSLLAFGYIFSSYFACFAQFF